MADRTRSDAEFGGHQLLLSPHARHHQVIVSVGVPAAKAVTNEDLKQTRDGLSSTELLRLAYLDTVTARAIQERGAHGNAAILQLHEHVARKERLNWVTPPQAG